MKKLFVIVFLIVFEGTLTQAQQDVQFKKWEIKTGMGLFINLLDLNILTAKYKGSWISHDPPGSSPNRKVWYGRSTWVQIAYRWDKKYEVYANYYINPYKVRYNDELGLWRKIDEKQVYHSVRSGVNRIFNADGKFSYKIGLGLVYQREIAERAIYRIRPFPGLPNNEKIGVADYAEQSNTDEAGVDLNFDATYGLSSTAYIGARFNTYYLYKVGLEGIIISPYIAIRF